MAMLRENRFGMELHALDRGRAVAHAHDLAVVGPRRHLELGRARLALDRQGMVPRGLVGRGQPPENARACVMDARHLAVHERLRMHDTPAEGLADRLVSEADTENGNL